MTVDNTKTPVDHENLLAKLSSLRERVQDTSILAEASACGCGRCSACRLAAEVGSAWDVVSPAYQRLTRRAEEAEKEVARLRARVAMLHERGGAFFDAVCNLRAVGGTENSSSQVDAYCDSAEAFEAALKTSSDTADEWTREVEARALRVRRSPCCDAAIRCGRCGHDLSRLSRPTDDKAMVERDDRNRIRLARAVFAKTPDTAHQVSWSEILTEIEGLQRLANETTCDACSGTGRAIGDRPCGCGGSGRLVDMLQSVRYALHDESQRSERLRSVIVKLTEQARAYLLSSSGDSSALFDAVANAEDALAPGTYPATKNEERVP